MHGEATRQKREVPHINAPVATIELERDAR